MSRRHRPRRICGAPVTTSKGNAATCGGTFRPAVDEDRSRGLVRWLTVPGFVECSQCGRRAEGRVA